MRPRVYRRGAHGDAVRRYGDPGQTEVENLRLPSIGDEDVRGLDIPVDDVFRMCRVESVGDLDAQIEHRPDLQRLASDQVPKGLSLEELHSNQSSAIDLIDFVNGADIRVIECRGGARLTVKSLKRPKILGPFFRKELEREMSAELKVFCLVHSPIPPPPSFRRIR